MKVKEVFETFDDYRDALTIYINGKMSFSFCDGEVEDANLSRDFNDCYGIVDALRDAYEAGKRGEAFEYDSEEIDDSEVDEEDE